MSLIKILWEKYYEWREGENSGRAVDSISWLEEEAILENL